MFSSLADEMATLVGAGLLVTLGTNLDNLVVVTALAGTLADGRRRGQRALWMAAGLLVVLAWGLAAAMDGLPDGAMRWMGLLPIAFGLKAGLGAWRSRGSKGGGGLDPAGAGGTSATGNPAQVARGSMLVLLLVNSTDTLATLIPLMAETATGLRLALVAGMALGTAVLAFVLGAALRQAGLRAQLARHGDWLAPVIMILVGIYILADTGTDLV